MVWKSIPRKGILFDKNIYYQSIEACINVDWSGDKGDRQSTFGYFTFVNGNHVT